MTFEKYMNNSFEINETAVKNILKKDRHDVTVTTDEYGNFIVTFLKTGHAYTVNTAGQIITSNGLEIAKEEPISMDLQGKWDMELEVELGSRFVYNSTNVVDYVTKTSNIKLHYENGKVTVDSADLEYGVSNQQSAKRWNVSIRVKSVTIKSFIQYEHNIVNDKNWKTELNINLGSIFTTTSETVTDYVTKDAQLELRYINGEIIVYNLDSEYGNSNVTSAEQWNVKIRIKSIDINDFSIL